MVLEVDQVDRPDGVLAPKVADALACSIAGRPALTSVGFMTKTARTSHYRGGP